MNIRILLILLAISMLLGFTKRWRKMGLLLSVVLAALLIWFTVNQPVTNQDSGAPTASTSSSVVTQAPRVAPIATLRLDGNGAPWRLSGNVANPGDMPIRSVTLSVERLDCPVVDSIEADCNLVWRGQHTLRVQIAATSSARIDESFYSHETVPRFKGVARDRITVIAAQ